jgi:hypothetical protein
MKNFKNLLLTAWTVLCIVSCGNKVINDAKANLLKEFAKKWYTEVIDEGNNKSFMDATTVDAETIIDYVKYDKEIQEKSAFMTVVALKDTLFWTLATTTIQNWQSTEKVDMIIITRHYETEDMFNNPFIHILDRETIGIIAETSDWDLVMWEPTTEPESNIVDLDNRKPKDTTPQVSQKFKDALRSIAEKFYKN